MLIFQITKTNTPLPQKGLAPILIAPPNTYVYATQAAISSVKQSKTNVTHLSRRNKATSVSDRRPSRSLSSLQCWKVNPIFTRVLLLALYRTIELAYRIHYNQWCCLHWIPDSKLLPRSMYDVLTQISNDFRLMSVMCTERSLLRITSKRPLLLIGYKFVLVFGRLSFLKRFWKNTYPTFKTSINYFFAWKISVYLRLHSWCIARSLCK